MTWYVSYNVNGGESKALMAPRLDVYICMDAFFEYLVDRLILRDLCTSASGYI